MHFCVIDRLKTPRALTKVAAFCSPCVKQWQYDPTYLNGTPVAVILTAKVSFLRKIAF